MTGNVFLAMVASAVVTSFTDWFFFAVWMHERYRTHPEVWRRPQGGSGQTRAVVISALFSVLTNVGFVVLCVVFGTTGLRHALTAGVLTWLAFPVPALVTNWLFLKLDPLLLVPHLTGWLVRVLVTAGVVGWLV